MLLSDTSVQRLSGVHPDLVRVVDRAAKITSNDFVVVDGVRTLAQQEQKMKAGLSTTMHSRHLSGHAVDLAPLLGSSIPWDDKAKFLDLAEVMKKAADMENVPITCGADWKTFPDLGHFELPWDKYPLEVKT